MLKLFQYGTCPRSFYFVLLALLLAFDFAKGPMEEYLATTAEQTKLQIYAAEAPKLQEMHQSMVGELKAGAGQAGQAGEAPADERVEAHVSAMVATAVEMEAKTAAVGSIYITSLVILGLITLVAMIWMVFARVRDIGWPVWVGFAVLSPALALRLFGADMPEVAYYGVQYGFIGALIALGSLPGGFGNEPVARPSPSGPRAVRAARIPGQFGRRG